MCVRIKNMDKKGWGEGKYDPRQYLKAWGMGILLILLAIFYFGPHTQTTEDRVLCMEHGGSFEECRREGWETGFFIVSLIAIGMAVNKMAKDFSKREAGKGRLKN